MNNPGLGKSQRQEHGISYSLSYVVVTSYGPTGIYPKEKDKVLWAGQLKLQNF